MAGVLPKIIFANLCENQGCVEFGRFKEVLRRGHFTVDNSVLLKILSEDGKYAVSLAKEIQADTLVVAKTHLRVCQQVSGKCSQCDNLHLCRYLICGNCRYGNECKNYHDVASEYNLALLKEAGLQDLTEKQLFQLLLQNDDYLLPKICSHYNRGNGEHGSCTFTTSCTNLHVCRHFLQADCKFGDTCKRAHSFNEQIMKILKGRGLSKKNIQLLGKIYHSKSIIKQPLPDIEVPIRNLQIRATTSETTAAPATSEADRNEICLYFLRQHCSFKEKCVRVHYQLPYRWQVQGSDSLNWIDLPNMENKEKAYCDPKNNVKLLGETVRRLSTVSSVSKPNFFILTTDWLWYWQDVDGSWVEYGHNKEGESGGSPASVNSETLERVYLSEEETEGFSAGNQQYIINFKGAMTAHCHIFRDVPAEREEENPKRGPQTAALCVCTGGEGQTEGSYFARDASYSDMYSRAHGSRRKVMFVAHVLVGEFTTGSSSYARPPSRSTGKGLYDSCVNNIRDPGIFVVFEKHQIYPEMAGVVSKCIFANLCENQGCLEFGRFKEVLRRGHITVDNSVLLKILSDDGKYAVSLAKEIQADTLVVAKTHLRVCHQVPGKCSQCNNLHLCRHLICGNCRYGKKCKYSHDVASEYNLALLMEAGLQNLSEKQLFQLLLLNDDYLLPEICSHYNRGNGEHGICKFTTSCTNLHVCQHFLQADCKFGDTCKRAHSFNEQIMKILKGRGLSKKNIQLLGKIYHSKSIIKQPLPDIEVPIRNLQIRATTSETTAAPATSEADRNEICLYFLCQHCSFKEKCVRVHYQLPYRWQVQGSDSLNWIDLPNMENTEKAYCDPKNNVKLLGETVRRLSTVSSVSKPNFFILTTDWLWYWQDEDGSWVEYGHNKEGESGGSPASVNSETLERVYLSEKETEGFSAGNQQYIINFKGAMTGSSLSL
ncbi:Poly [ADP-ribose] polymerase 12 [Merluccius polli]|uniref:Poly [ADP-ribose] polymerase 12 n=1 Tax=Merluccius polli TaxID=89951 RepID=A0AA47N6S7_MERPO|nr:Poly [ADP-ribose] polymerase 12 [Merluccius polli]